MELFLSVAGVTTGDPMEKIIKVQSTFLHTCRAYQDEYSLRHSDGGRSTSRQYNEGPNQEV